MAKNDKNTKNSSTQRSSTTNGKAWQQVVMAAVGVIIIFTMVVTLFIH